MQLGSGIAVAVVQAGSYTAASLIQPPAAESQNAEGAVQKRKKKRKKKKKDIRVVQIDSGTRLRETLVK